MDEQQRLVWLLSIPACVVWNCLFVCLFVDGSPVFVKTVFKSSFCFSYVLFVAAVAVYHVNNAVIYTVHCNRCHCKTVFRVTVYMMGNMSSFAGRMKCVAGTSVCYVGAS